MARYLASGFSKLGGSAIWAGIRHIHAFTQLSSPESVFSALNLLGFGVFGGAEATGFEPILSTPEYRWRSVNTDLGDCPSSVKHYQTLFGATRQRSGGAVNAPVVDVLNQIEAKHGRWGFGLCCYWIRNHG